MLLWAASHQLDAIRIISLFLLNLFSSVQFSPFSYVRLCAMPWTAACQASLSITDSWILLNLMSLDLVMPSNHLILSSPSLPAFNVSYIGVFSNKSVLPIRWGNNLSFSFSIVLPVNTQNWFFFRMDWFDLLQSKGLSRVFFNTIVQKAYMCILCQWRHIPPVGI